MARIDKSSLLKNFLSEEVKYAKYKIAKKSDRKKVVITNWNSELGLKKFRESKYNTSFFKIAHNYVAQINPFYCGVACITTVMNGFRAKKGLIPNQEEESYTKQDGTKIEYRYYTQLNILDENTDKIKPREKIAPCFDDGNGDKEGFDPGLNLEEVKQIFEYHYVDAKKHECVEPYDKVMDDFKSDLKRVLSDKKELMILNFDGDICGLPTGGHFSTLGAYNEEMDAILILDSAGFKNPWFWVPVKHIYHAMNSKDSNGNYRGYLILKDEFDEILSL